MALSFGNATVDAYSANLVSLWNMQEASDTRYDETANSRDMIDAYNYYGVTSDTGPNGAHVAGAFSGSDWLYWIPSYPTLTDFSLSCWVFNYELNGARAMFTVGNVEEDTGAFSWAIGDAWSSGSYNEMVFTHNDNAGWYVDYRSGDFGMTTYGWYHLVLTRTGSTVTFYSNGSSVATDSTSQALNSGQAAHIGISLTSGDYPVNFLSGRLTQMVVWDTAISGAAVTALYNSGDGLFDINDVTYRYSALDSQRDLLRYMRTHSSDGQRNTAAYYGGKLDA